jgi:PAS domain S-box-containing protein
MGVYNPRERRYHWISINAVPLFREPETKPYQVYTTFDDITERRRAERTLRLSELKFARAFANNPAAIALTRLEDGLFLDVNDTWVALTGFSREEVIGHSARKMNIWPTTEAAEQFVRKLREAGVLRGCEQVFRKKSGELYTAELSAQLLTLDGDQLVLATLLDITERKRAEAALRAANARLEKVLAVETVGVMFWDVASGVMVDANDTLLKLLGYRRREMQAGKLTWQKLTPPEFLELSRAEIQEFAKTGRVGPYEKQYFRKDGSRQWFIFAGSALDDRTVVEFCVDISARKRAEDCLRETKEQIQYFVQNTKDILFQMDLKGNFTFGNAAAERVTGYPLARLLGMNMTRLVAPEYHGLVRQRLRRRIAGRAEETPFECEILHQDGCRSWLELATSSVRNSEGRLVAIQGVAREITERKNAERLLQNANRTLRVIRDCHEAMLRAETEPTLLRTICHIIGRAGQNQMVWVGYAENDARKTVRPMATTGDAGYLAAAGITWADQPRGRGPVGSAIRTGRVSLCQNTQTEPCFKPWRGMARRHGFNSVIALPLLQDGKCFGALSIYAREPAAFDDAEKLLLTDLANDLAYGINTLRLRAERARLEDEILKSIEREQERIGRDLHDGLCQVLAGAKFRSGYLQRISRDRLPAVEKEARMLEQILNKAIEQARDLARGLNPVKVTPAGLPAALEKLAADAQSAEGPRCFFRSQGAVRLPDHHAANHLYRIAQEAVQNALKHARARNIAIILAAEGRRIVLSVKDDGAGLPGQIKKTGMGLNNMRIRAGLIGGHLEIRRRKNGGTTVRCEIVSANSNQRANFRKKPVPAA